MSLKPLQLQFADLPRKPPQPGVLKKSPQPEFPHLANKPVQAEFPRKPLHPEFTGLKKPSQAEFTDLKKPPQPQFASLPKKPPKPEFGELSKRPPQLETPQEPSAPPAQKLLKPEPNNPARPLGELKPKMFWHLEANEAPKRPLPSESSTFPKKPLQPEAVVGFSRKSQPQSESIEVSQTSPSKCGSRELDSHSPQPDISTFPKNNENFRNLHILKPLVAPSPQSSPCSMSSPRHPLGSLSHVTPSLTPRCQTSMHSLRSIHSSSQVTLPGHPRSLKSARFPKRLRSQTPMCFLRSPHSQNWVTSLEHPRTPSSTRSRGSFCSLNTASSSSLSSPRVCLESPSFLVQCLNAPCPLLVRAPAPSALSALGL